MYTRQLNCVLDVVCCLQQCVMFPVITTPVYSKLYICCFVYDGFKQVHNLYNTCTCNIIMHLFWIFPQHSVTGWTVLVLIHLLIIFILTVEMEWYFFRYVLVQQFVICNPVYVVNRMWLTEFQTDFFLRRGKNWSCEA